MKPGNYVRFYMLSYLGNTHLLPVLPLMAALGIAMFCDCTGDFLSGAAFVSFRELVYGAAGILISVGIFLTACILFEVTLISAARRCRKDCRALEQRDRMASAAEQLRAQPHWGRPLVITRDYCFCRPEGAVLAMEDIVSIELVASTREDEDLSRPIEALELVFVTRRDETLKYSTESKRKKAQLRKLYETLQTRFPDKTARYAFRER